MRGGTDVLEGLGDVRYEVFAPYRCVRVGGCCGVIGDSLLLQVTGGFRSSSLIFYKVV